MAEVLGSQYAAAWENGRRIAAQINDDLLIQAQTNLLADGQDGVSNEEMFAFLQDSGLGGILGIHSEEAMLVGLTSSGIMQAALGSAFAGNALRPGLANSIFGVDPRSRAANLNNPLKHYLETGSATPGSIARLLTNNARQAVKNCGPGSGCVYGTKVHGEWGKLLSGLKGFGREVNYKNGVLETANVSGSIRLDLVRYNTSGQIIAVYDLKTGGATLTQTRINQIRSHLPESARNVPIIEIKP